MVHPTRLCLLMYSTAALWLAAPALMAAPVVEVPRFTHAGAGQTVYFLLTDRFANGSTANDLGGVAGGPELTGFDPERISHFHGGDFAGLTARLDYLKDLGITAVWVTPPFKNKPMQKGTAGYHGYWILDFLQIDPHLGTNEEFREFVRQTHARGMRVYMDIIVNHTADVIELEGDHSYRDRKTEPYRDAMGKPFDERSVAFNGLNDRGAFPALSVDQSFAYRPTVSPAEAGAKHPSWLNDPTLYHNRGNSTFAGENATLGDFVGLDDVFTEHPRVVDGFIDVFSTWIESCGVDGYRIDTARHVNTEFWQAFIPAIRARARELGRPDFIQFGEVYNEAGDPSVLAEFSTSTIPIDTTIDFGFFTAARRFVSEGGTGAALADFFARDDYYTDHDSNVHSTTTFLGNHDAGRFAYFLQQDNPGAPPEQLAALAKLGHGLLLLSRGQPVLYYGDEQGMIGRGGKDMEAREDMFAAQAPEFRTATLLATARTGADDKFDPQHPFYQFFSKLAALRAAHPGLRTGAMIPRTCAENNLFAFSRIERGDKVEYLVALNNSRTATFTGRIVTSQPGGAILTRIFDSRTPAAPGEWNLTANADGAVLVELEPLQFTVWRASQPLATPLIGPRISLVTPADGATLTFTSREVDGLTFPSRRETRAEVIGSDGLAEVTFAFSRESRPGQFELIGTDDAAPYRVFWNPPADLAAGEKLTIVATVNDLRGRRDSSQVAGVSIAPGSMKFGIQGATVPVLQSTPPARVPLIAGKPITLAVQAIGTGPLEYQWLHDNVEISGATSPTLVIKSASAADAGEYSVLVRNRAGTTISPTTMVAPTTTTTGTQGRLEKHPSFPSRHVAARQIDVWLPPGYDENPSARYPVIFMQDGQNIFDGASSFGGHSWDVDEAMCRLIRSGRTIGGIVVAVWNTAARTAEYMPQKAVSTTSLDKIDGLVHRTPDRVHSDAYLKFLVEEVKPFVDSTYRTLPDRAHTFIMGSSMGGLISAYALVEYPDTFGGAACLSPHWPAGNGAVIDYVAGKLPRPGNHHIYFDFGTATLDAGYETYQKKMDAAMQASGYVAGRDWITQKFPGAEHSERAWSQRVDLPLAFLLN